MTSASTKVNTTQLHQFRDCNRDVMPACVATSYPCINNEAYQREYRRDETGHLSEASSPDTPKYEDCYKSQLQCPQPLLYPGKLMEEVFSYSVSGKKRKFENTINKTSHRISMSPPQDNNKECCRSSSESCRDDSPRRENGRRLDAGVAGSPKQNHSLKKRILQKSENDLKNESAKKSRIEDVSKYSAEIDDDKSKKCSSHDPESSSEILRKMCASFGANFGNHFPGFSPFSKLKNLDNLDSHSSALCENIKPDSSEGTFTSKNEPHEFKPFPSPSAKSPCATQKQSCIHLQASNGSNRKKTVSVKQLKAFTPHKTTTVSHHRDNSQQKNKNQTESPKKRKFSAESYSSPNAGSVGNHLCDASPSQGPKRSRYSSSDSTDSQKRFDTEDAPNFYKQNGSWYPFVNPLLYSSGSFNPFGMHGNGCSMPPLPMSGYPHSNPLMFGSNPYLANSVMIREMMNTSGISNFMPFLPNANFSALSGSSRVSPQQLQALHQLQSAMLCQNPPLFHANNYQTPGMLPFVQNHLLASSRHLSSFNHVSTDKSNISKRTPSPEGTTSLITDDTKKLSLPVESAYPTFSSLTGRNNNYLNSHERHSCQDKSILSEKISKTKQILKISANMKRTDDSSKTSSHHKFLSHHTKTQSKKKSEKKAKDSTKLKDAIQKPSLIQSCSPSSIVSPDNNSAEDVALKHDESFPDGQSVKTSSYKNLTRERRLVANARERTRVHTISSAFDELRAQIPSYSCNQKLSKLAILRIACEYIRTLSVVVGHDECISFSQGVDQCTRVLQSESRARSRRKNNKAQIEMEMENYERHKSREEGDVKAGESGQTHCPSLFSHASSSCNSDRETLSSNFDGAQTDSQSVFVDDVNNDVTETDNDIVDVESVDDDNTNDFSDFAQRNSLCRSSLNNSSHSQREKEQISQSSPNSCQSFPNQATHSDTHSDDVVVE